MYLLRNLAVSLEHNCITHHVMYHDTWNLSFSDTLTPKTMMYEILLFLINWDSCTHCLVCGFFCFFLLFFFFFTVSCSVNKKRCMLWFSFSWQYFYFPAGWSLTSSLFTECADVSVPNQNMEINVIIFVLERDDQVWVRWPPAVSMSWEWLEQNDVCVSLGATDQWLTHCPLLHNDCVFRLLLLTELDVGCGDYHVSRRSWANK